MGWEYSGWVGDLHGAFLISCILYFFVMARGAKTSFELEVGDTGGKRREGKMKVATTILEWWCRMGERMLQLLWLVCDVCALVNR